MTDITHVNLETRICACGCGATFRVASTSSQTIAGTTHDRNKKVFDVGCMAKVTKEYKAILVRKRAEARAEGKKKIKGVA